MTIHGYSDERWISAKEEAKRILTRVAHQREVIAYSSLAAQIQSISFAASDQRFFFLLRDISSEEFRAGRGMLTAVVVHKAGDFKPGPGFFDLAKGLGLDTTDTDRLWIYQVTTVHDYWGTHPPR